MAVNKPVGDGRKALDQAQQGDRSVMDQTEKGKFKGVRRER